MASFTFDVPMVLLFCLLSTYCPLRRVAAYAGQSNVPANYATARTLRPAVPAECTKKIYVGPSGRSNSEAYWFKAINESERACGDDVRSACPTLEVAFKQYQVAGTKTPRQAQLPCFLLAASPMSNCEILIGNLGPTTGPFLLSNDSKRYILTSSSENGCRTAVLDMSAQRALQRSELGAETHYALLVFTDVVTLIGVSFITRRTRQPEPLYLIDSPGGITIRRCEFLLGPGVSALKVSDASTGDVDTLITDSVFTGIRAVDGSRSANPHNQPLLALSDWSDEPTYNSSVSFTISGCSFSNFSPFHATPLIEAKLESGGIAVLNTTFLSIKTVKSILTVSYPDTREASPQVKIEGSFFQNVTCLDSSCVLLTNTPGLHSPSSPFQKKTAIRAVVSILRCHFIAATHSLDTLNERNSSMCNAQGQAYWISIIGVKLRTVTITDCSFSSGPTVIASNSSDLVFTGTTTLLRPGRTYLDAQADCQPFIADWGSITVAGPVLIQMAPGFPKYPSVRKTIVLKVRYWRVERFTTGPDRAAPQTHQMNFSLTVQDMYCRIPYCQAARKHGWRGRRSKLLPRTNNAEQNMDKGTCYYQCISKWRFYSREWETIDDAELGYRCTCNLYNIPPFDNPRRAPCPGSSWETDTYADFELCAYKYRYGTRPMLVINKLNALEDLISTPASWMLFRSSTVQCYKNWRGYIYVLRNCSRDNWAALARALGWDNIATSPFTFLRDTMIETNASATNVVIGAKFAATPWSFLTGPPTISHHYCQHRKFGPQAKDCDDHIGSITLMPAPGEHVSFGIDTLDNGLSQVDVVLTLKVEEDSQQSYPDVWLHRLSTKIHDPVEELAFLSGRSLSDFALLGRPLTSGYLKVTMSSDGIGISELLIPFLLRPCNMGFELTSVTIRDKTTHTCSLVQQRGVMDEINGRSILVAPGYWAGDLLPTLKTNMQHYLTVPAYKIPLVGSAEDTLSRDYFKHQLGIAQCTNRFCLNESWWIHSGEGSGCVAGYTGPLCGHCEVGLSLRVATMICARSGSQTLNIYIYISLIIVLTLLAFIVMFYFNFGMSPLVDSWLFYYQVGLFLPNNYYLKEVGVLGTVLSFGLGHLGIAPEINRLQATFLFLTQPLTLLISVVSVRIAASYARAGNFIQRQQKHMRLIRVLWFGLVYSYTMLTFTSLNVLSCTKLGNKLVLAMDGSIECFKGNHIPYAVCSVVIIVLIIIPPPILLILPQAKRKLFFKGFIDQACCMYHDNRRWWASVNLVRRIAVAVILSQLRRTEEKAIVMTVFLFGYVFLHTCWRPLSQTNFLDIDSNAVEKYFLFSLLLLAVLNSVAKATPEHLLAGFRVATYVIIYAPTTVLLCSIVFRQCFSKRGGFGRLRHVSLRAWSKRRRGEDVNALATHNLALRNMLSEARDPLIVEEMRNEQH